MRYCLNYSLVFQGFCPLKINSTQLPNGFRLNLLRRGIEKSENGRTRSDHRYV